VKTAKAHNEQLTGWSELSVVKEPRFDAQIVFCAFRYALGRKTYIVSTVVNYLIQNWKWMTPKFQGLIHKEINKAVEEKWIGMEMDKTQWLRVLELPCEESSY